MTVIEIKEQLRLAREVLLAEIKTCLPSEQAYVNLSLYAGPGNALVGIKYLMPDGSFGLYEARKNQLECNCIEELPVEALADLLEALKPSA